jgi:N-acetylglucosaminyldiphosphoundecaprenol N-acetyl-beta-D-mannosaminyltransferase
MASEASFEKGDFAQMPVLGLPVAICNYSEAVALLRGWARHSNAPRLVAAANTHLVTISRRDAQFTEVMKQFDLIVPDGMPLVWYLNGLHHAGLSDRVYGPDLMRRCLAASEESDRHFLLGGTAEERQRLEEMCRHQYPAVRIVGSYSPPFRAWPLDEDQKIIRLLKAAQPNFVWVGLGCPKQELLLARLKNALPPSVCLAVGAAFPLLAGTLKQAPPALQRLGLEWAFRLLMEPRRLWRRYLVNNTLFVCYTMLEVLQKKTR